MQKTTVKTEEKMVINAIKQKTLANFLVNSFNGIISVWEEQGAKLGSVFATIQFRKPMKMRKFHRIAKTADGKKMKNPYLENVFEVGKVLINFNYIWENVVDNQVKRTDGIKTDWTPDKKRANGIENYKESRVVCIHPKKGTFYLNYKVEKYLENTRYVDKDNNEYDYSEIQEYHQKPSRESKEKEALKHGLKIENDPQVRQMKFDNITLLSIFGFKFQPMK